MIENGREKMDEVVSDLGIRIVRTFSLKDVAKPFAKVGVFVYKVTYFVNAVFIEHFLVPDIVVGFLETIRNDVDWHYCWPL